MNLRIPLRPFVAAALVALGRRARAGELTWAAHGGALGWSIAGVTLATLCGAASVPLLTAGFRQWLDYVHAPELAGCAAGLVLGLLIMLVGLAVRRGRGEVPRLGPLLVWLLLAGLCAALAPGLSHLFTWPAAALLVAAPTLEWRDDNRLILRSSGHSAELARLSPPPPGS